MVFRDIELEQAMARRQRHPVDVGGVPGGDNQAPGIRTAADGLDDAGHLVNGATVRPGPGAPLPSINRPEIALLVRPFVPDRDAVVIEIFDIGIAGEKPEQLVGDRLEMKFLGGRQRKACSQIESHLVAEHRQRPGAGAIAFFSALGKDPFQ